MALPKPPCPKCDGVLTLVHAWDNRRFLECDNKKCFHKMDYDEWLNGFIEQLQKDLAFWKEEAQAEEKRANALKAQIKERAAQLSDNATQAMNETWRTLKALEGDSDVIS